MRRTLVRGGKTAALGERPSPLSRSAKHQAARSAGLGRESLSKALSPTGNPEFVTILKVMAALGLPFHVALTLAVG
jgi:probable addiction module antidote protein